MQASLFDAAKVTTRETRATLYHSICCLWVSIVDRHSSSLGGGASSLNQWYLSCPLGGVGLHTYP